MIIKNYKSGKFVYIPLIYMLFLIHYKKMWFINWDIPCLVRGQRAGIIIMFNSNESNSFPIL